MKRLTLAVIKGGQGKTTIACHLAAYAAQCGLRTLCIDLDDQCNASLALEPWINPGGVTSNMIFDDGFDPQSLTIDSLLTVIPASQGEMDLSTVEDSVERLSAALTAWDPLFDLCVIDTPPSITANMGAAALNSHYVLSPMEPEVFALDGVSQMMDLVERFQEANPQLEFLGIIPNRIRNNVSRHVRNVEMLRNAYADIVLPCSLSNRDAFAEAMEAQCPCWELKKSAARAAKTEFFTFANLVLRKMHLKTKRKLLPLERPIREQQNQ